MRRNISAVSFTDGNVPADLTKGPRASAAPASLVDMREVPRAALAVALKLAGGDASRLTFLPDGTVMVTNRPRPARRTQERFR